MDKHTPGPWHTTPLTKQIAIYDQQGTAIAKGSDAYGMSSEERWANACLLAASPSLLAVLQEVEPLLDALDSGAKADDYTRTIHRALLNVRAVIAQATDE